VWVSASKTVEKRNLELETARIALDDDLAETVIKGVLEVRPRRGAGGWILQLRVDDQAGEHPVSDEDTDEEGGLTLEAFEAEFLLPEGQPVDIAVSADDGGAQFRGWLRRTRLDKQENKMSRRSTPGQSGGASSQRG
jgi:hypothetical protein